MFLDFDKHWASLRAVKHQELDLSLELGLGACHRGQGHALRQTEVGLPPWEK